MGTRLVHRWSRTLLALGAAWPLPAPGALAQPEQPEGDHAAARPVLVTARTRADAAALGELEKPGTILFEDGFESPDSLASYFEVRGVKEGHASLTTDRAIAHSGAGALQLTAPANEGESSGSGAEYWFGPGGHDRVYLRVYIKFAGDYDQGNLNHTGPSLAGVAGDSKWGGMGAAGLRPRGDDRFSTRFEPWRDWGRLPAPGYLFFYTYWMDMEIDRDGNYWGNMLGPEEGERVVPERGRWYCLEQMIKTNAIADGAPRPDGELAGWIDGRLYVHYTGIRWRSSDAVRLKRFALIVYVHQARRDNTVWYDDVTLSTGYVGAVKETGSNGPDKAAPR